MMMVEILEMPEPLGLFSAQLFKRATDYLEAFKALTTADPDEHLLHPSYFLCVHALELYLKSYLAANNIQKSVIRSMGHKLPEILSQCEALALPNVPDLAIFVPSVFEMNNDHDFRYPMNYNLRVPKQSMCVDVLSALQAKLAPIVGRAQMEADLQHQADTRSFHGKRIRWSD